MSELMITRFEGEFRFLSNFYPCKLNYLGYDWPSAEHAYQAMKIPEGLWSSMSDIRLSPGNAKKIGSMAELPDDWDDKKLVIMREIVTRKFEQNEDLMDLLMKTKGCELIECNRWNDRFWGQCPVGYGRNELGRTLMSIRDDITRR